MTRHWGNLRRPVLRRLLSGEQRVPPILANSFPKSGTHLLDQILSAIPGTRDLGGFLASVPSRPYERRDSQDLVQKLSGLIPGEIIKGHLEWTAEVERAMDRRGVFHAFIYRDLRDVILSEVNYLTYMNRWHSLHRFFLGAGTMSARVELAIEGLPEMDAYPNIGLRFARYEPWLENRNVVPLRFEEVRNDSTRRDALEEFFESYLHEYPLGELTAADLADLASDAIAPGESHTFRGGEVARWKEDFPPVLLERARELVQTHCSFPPILW